MKKLKYIPVSSLAGDLRLCCETLSASELASSGTRRIPPKPMRKQWIGKSHWLRAFIIRTKVKHPRPKCVTTACGAGPAAT